MGIPIDTGKPASACRPAVVWIGFLAFAAANGLIVTLKPFEDVIYSAVCIVSATAIAIALADTLIGKAHSKPSTGLDWADKNPSWPRTLLKYLGLLGSFGAVAFGYWLFPEYHGGFYDRYYALLSIALPPFLVLALPYFYWIDAHMREPKDGYWQMGRCLLLQWHEVDFSALLQHLLGWLVKAYFTPLMFIYFCNDLERLQAINFSALNRFSAWFDFFHDLIFYVDVAYAFVGYVVSLRIIDTHIRSVEPTLAGWVVALVCYQPFWSLIGPHYLAYETSYRWGTWLATHPFWYVVWGVAILSCLLVYTWSTLMFGLRFSNLTHRGIITSGPYAWMKHPAYVSKNLSFWLISIPFIIHGSASEALRHSLLLLGLNGIYLLRAITEERHLSQDPDYVNYSAWMAWHGLFRRNKTRATDTL